MNRLESNNKFKIDFRVLSILLLLAAVPLLTGSWWLFKTYENVYLEMVGTNLGESAEMAFSYLNVFLQNQIIVTAGLTESPSLREVVRRGNLDLEKSLEGVRKDIVAQEGRWPSLDRNSPEVKSILNNPASDYLRRYISVNKFYREILVTDFLGRLVAATGKTTDYYQADEDWWKETYADGRRGSVYIGDIQYDESAKLYSMEVAQPFVEPEKGVVGVLKAVVDAQEIHSLLGSMHAGPSAAAVLIHAKGKILSAPGHSVTEQANYPATLDILTAREKGRRFFVSTESPPAIYGLSESKFQELYPHLNWILVTRGAVNEILAPLGQLQRYFIALVVAIILLTLVAALLLSRVESKPIVEVDPHLERL